MKGRTRNVLLILNILFQQEMNLAMSRLPLKKQARKELVLSKKEKV